MNRLSTYHRYHHGPRQSTRLIAITLVALLVVMTALSSGLAGVPRAALAQSTAPVTASVIPADVMAYIAIDLDQESSQVTKANNLMSRIGAGSVEDLVGSMSSSTTGEDVTANINTDALLGGEAGLAIFNLGDEMSSVAGAVEGGLSGGLDAATTAAALPSMAAVISAADPDAAYTSVETTLEDDATTAGLTIVDQTYEGTTIRVLPADESMGTEETAIAKVGDFVVIGTSADDVEKVIDAEAGRIPTLADSDDYKAVAAQLNTEWLISGYVNAATASAAATTDPSVTSTLGGVDLSALQSHAGFVIRADDPGFIFDGIVIPTADGALPAANSFNAELPGMLPSNTVALVNGYDLGASGVLDAIFLAALNSLTGSVEGSVATPSTMVSPEEIANQQYQQLEAILGFNVKTDFIDQMVGEWGIAVWGLNADAAASMDPTSVKFLLVSNTQTPATIADAVSKLSLLLQASLSGQGTVTTRLIGQDQINVLTINDPSVATPVSIEYGVVNGKFVISYNGAIDELNSGGDTLADNANYKAAMAELPTDKAGQIYIDLSQIVPIAEQVAAASASSFEFTDASESCANYETQAEAQAAYDADQSTNWDLDQDFDGQACEDYFSPASPTAIPSSTTGQYDALTAFAAVSYQKDNMVGASAILLIGE